METKSPPPVTLDSDGIAIHLNYIRRDIDEIKVNQKANSEAVQSAFNDLKNGYVSRLDFNEHIKQDEDHETRIRGLQTFQDNLTGRMWGIGVLSGLVMGVISLLVGHYWK